MRMLRSFKRTPVLFWWPAQSWLRDGWPIDDVQQTRLACWLQVVMVMEEQAAVDELRQLERNTSKTDNILLEGRPLLYWIVYIAVLNCVT